MKRALVISSQVAASTVGANASAFCLRRMGVETVFLPTTLMGRHPGWGSPGGDLTPFEILAGMWEGISAQNLKFDAVLTGYMGRADNVKLAVKIIRQLNAANPKTAIIVDPVMGDNGQLYVPVDVAEAIEAELLPLADFITPNIWEFSHLMKSEFSDRASLKNALNKYQKSALITSVQNQSQIGGLFSHKGALTYIGHTQFDKVPHGGGDALAGVFLAHWLSGESGKTSAARAVSSIFAIMKHAYADGSDELPLTRYQALLSDAKDLKMQEF